jgi:hypothetical protein
VLEPDVFVIGTAVTMATEILKTTLPEEQGKAAAPYASLALSLVFTTLYVLSQPTLPGRTDMWMLAMAVITVDRIAAGVYHGAKLAMPKR